ncbi:MAG: hypothetical protein ABF384_05400 [Verrucomicrobiales bacterium]
MPHATEFVASATYSQTTFTVTSLDDSGTGTLREAIATAPDDDTILFADNLAGGMTTGQLVIRIQSSPGITMARRRRTLLTSPNRY